MSQSATAGNSTTHSNDDTTSKLWEAHSLLESIDESTVESMGDEELVRLREAVKAIDDLSETVRKDATDSELKDRIPVGGEIHGISHIESHRKFVDEDPVTVIMRAVAKEIDYTEFVDISATTLAKEYPDLTEIGENEFSYLR